MYTIIVEHDFDLYDAIEAYAINLKKEAVLTPVITGYEGYSSGPRKFIVEFKDLNKGNY